MRYCGEDRNCIGSNIILFDKRIAFKYPFASPEKIILHIAAIATPKVSDGEYKIIANIVLGIFGI